MMEKRIKNTSNTVQYIAFATVSIDIINDNLLRFLIEYK
jgi:hypothetical protein